MESLDATQINSTLVPSTTLEWTSSLVAVVLCVIVGLTVGGNILILAAVGTNSSLRGPTHILIANLAVADLLLGLLVLPFSATLEVINVMQLNFIHLQMNSTLICYEFY